MSHELQVSLSDGRILACCCVGNPSGPVVFHNHGGPSSRREVLLLEDAALRAGLRLIGVDRPGVGGSSPHPGRSLRQWADDLRALADQLGVRTFAVTGWSEGGPWALSCAAGIPADRLKLAVNIAGGSYGALGDNWAAPLQSATDRLGGWLCLHLHPGFRLMYDVLEWDAVHFPAQYLKQIQAAVNGYDRRWLGDPEVGRLFLDATRECFRQGSAGLVEDATLLYRNWGIDWSQIQVPVSFWQGDDDHLVPQAINRPVAEAIPGAKWHGVAGAGHCVLLGEADAILAECKAALVGG